MREVLTSYGIGVTVAVGVSLAWVWVQSACRRSAPDGSMAADMLNGHCGCLGCEPAATCGRGTPGEGA